MSLLFRTKVFDLADILQLQFYEHFSDDKVRSFRCQALPENPCNMVISRWQSGGAEPCFYLEMGETSAGFDGLGERAIKAAFTNLVNEFGCVKIFLGNEIDTAMLKSLLCIREFQAHFHQLVKNGH